LDGLQICVAALLPYYRIEIIKVKVVAQIKFLTDTEKAYGCHPTGSMGF
jgi:hypothetical protein